MTFTQGNMREHAMSEDEAGYGLEGDGMKLDYARAGRRGRTGLIVLGICLPLAVVLMWGLFELQRMPYRPPFDMSTLLDGEEIIEVRFTMGVLGVFLVGGTFQFVRLVVRGRSGS